METKVCKECGKELPIDMFRVTHLGRRNTCNDCVTKKIVKTKECKKQAKENLQQVQDARTLRLSDFTPRELMQELYRRGYEGVLEFTIKKHIDISKLDES